MSNFAPTISDLSSKLSGYLSALDDASVEEEPVADATATTEATAAV